MSLQEESILLRKKQAEVGVRTKNPWGCTFFVPVLTSKGKMCFYFIFFRTAEMLLAAKSVKFGLDMARIMQQTERFSVIV